MTRTIVKTFGAVLLITSLAFGTAASAAESGLGNGTTTVAANPGIGTIVALKLNPQPLPPRCLPPGCKGGPGRPGPHFA
jgi:hypothetical protein